MASSSLFDYNDFFDMPDVENYALDLPVPQDEFVLPFTLGPVGCPELFNLDASASSAYFPAMAGNAERNQVCSEAVNAEEQLGGFQGNDFLRSSFNEIGQVVQKHTPETSRRPPCATIERPRRRRRQNHACDFCRSAKRACDLPADPSLLGNPPSSPCSMCKMRGTDCTVTWRASKQASYPKKLAPHSIPQSGVEPCKDPASLSTPSLASSESHLICHMMTRKARLQRLGVYFDIVENPMSRFLAEKYLPPGFCLGITALTPLSRNAKLVGLFSKIQSSIENCWEITSCSQMPISAVPRVFFATIALDALLHRTGPPSENVQLRLRDMILIETYKWVAIAAGSQFAVHDKSTERSNISHQQARDIAYTTWCKAKSMVFTNIAAQKSFSLGLTLLLFGSILPPTETDRSHLFEEDASYAFHEGVRRLQMLCAESRAYLSDCDIQRDINTPSIGLPEHMEKPHLLQGLSSETRKIVLELIAACEKLVEMSQSVAIVLSPRRSFTATSSISSYETRSVRPIEETVQGISVNGATDERRILLFDDAFFSRRKRYPQPVLVLWTRGAPDHLVDSALDESASLVILMWKSLARLIQLVQKASVSEAEYGEILSYFNTTVMLIDRWRQTFGQIDRDIARRLRLASTAFRRCTIFCATDGDLAVLIFYEISRQLQKRLASQSQLPRNSLYHRLRLTSHYRDVQRLKSALQVSFLATTNLGISSPGFQGEAGLKANIEDVRAHPHPTMVVQAYKLACKGLAEEIRNPINTADTKHMSDLSAALDSCVRELGGLKRTLIMFPETEWGTNLASSS